MAGLFALIGLLGMGASIVSKEIKNYERLEAGTYSDGSKMYLDGHNKRRAENGERVETISKYIDGSLYYFYVGARTGKVYYDGYQDALQRKRAASNEARKEAERMREPIYWSWNEHFGKKVPVETHTGRAIACIKDVPFLNVYKKYYLTDRNPKYNVEEPFDDGVDIKKDEFDTLKIYRVPNASINAFYRIYLQKSGVRADQDVIEDYRRHCIENGRPDEVDRILYPGRFRSKPQSLAATSAKKNIDPKDVKFRWPD